MSAAVGKSTAALANSSRSPLNATLSSAFVGPPTTACDRAAAYLIFDEQGFGLAVVMFEDLRDVHGVLPVGLVAT